MQVILFFTYFLRCFLGAPGWSAGWLVGGWLVFGRRCRGGGWLLLSRRRSAYGHLVPGCVWYTKLTFATTAGTYRLGLASLWEDNVEKETVFRRRGDDRDLPSLHILGDVVSIFGDFLWYSFLGKACPIFRRGVLSVFLLRAGGCINAMPKLDLHDRHVEGVMRLPHLLEAVIRVPETHHHAGLAQPPKHGRRCARCLSAVLVPKQHRASLLW